MESWSRRFARTPAAPELSRSFGSWVLRGRISDEACSVVLLLIGELASNAVLHTDAEWVDISIEKDADCLSVGVSDRGSGFRPPRLKVVTEQRGHGMELVDGLSSRWGVNRDPNGTEVWFELDSSRLGGGGPSVSALQ